MSMIRSKTGWRKLEVPANKIQSPTFLYFEMSDDSELEIRRNGNSVEIIMGETFSNRFTISATGSGKKCILTQKCGDHFHGFSVSHGAVSVHCNLIPQTAQNDKCMAMLPDLFRAAIGEVLEVHTEIQKKVHSIH